LPEAVGRFVTSASATRTALPGHDHLRKRSYLLKESRLVILDVIKRTKHVAVDEVLRLCWRFTPPMPAASERTPMSFSAGWDVYEIDAPLGESLRQMLR
jgi:hypothetical protein